MKKTLSWVSVMLALVIGISAPAFAADATQGADPISSGGELDMYGEDVVNIGHLRGDDANIDNITGGLITGTRIRMTNAPIANTDVPNLSWINGQLSPIKINMNALENGQNRQINWNDEQQIQINFLLNTVASLQAQINTTPPPSSSTTTRVYVRSGCQPGYQMNSVHTACVRYDKGGGH